MEKRGITTEIPDTPEEVKEYTEDFQDKLSKRVVKQFTKVNNGSTTTRTSGTDKRSSVS